MATLVKAKKSYRSPTYGAATRLAQIVHGVLTRPHGWSVQAIIEDLRISERTVYRYLKTLREELVDGDGRPVIDEARYEQRRVLRLPITCAAWTRPPTRSPSSISR